MNHIQRRNLAKLMGVKEEDVTDQDFKNSIKDTMISGAKNSVAAPAALASGIAMGEVLNSGDLTGVKTMFHSTSKDAVDSIKKEGIKASHGDDYKSFTSQKVGLGRESFKNKTYVGNKKATSRSVGAVRRMNGYGSGKILNVKIPLDDLKKMNIVDNPELYGAKNADEFVKNWRGANPFSIIDDSQLRRMYPNLSKGTTTFEGDIPSKYIKGGEGYVRNNAKQILKHIKSNPKQFSKGVGKLGVAAGLGALSAHTLYSDLSPKQSRKRLLAEREKQLNKSSASAEYALAIEKIAMDF